MTNAPRSDTLQALAARGIKLRARDIFAHMIVYEGADGVSEMLVGRLDASTCAHLADLAKHLLAKRMRIVSPVRLRAPDGFTLDVVVATDLTTGRQAVVRISDGVRVRCGKVRHEGVETLTAALKEAQEKDGGQVPQVHVRTATPPKGRGRSSHLTHS